MCAEGRPCAPQGLASLVQSLCGCLLQRLVRKPCAKPCADVFSKRLLFFNVALQKNKMVGLEKVPCAVPCAGLRRPCAAFFGRMDHAGAHVVRSGPTPKTYVVHKALHKAFFNTFPCAALCGQAVLREVVLCRPCAEIILTEFFFYKK